MALSAKNWLSQPKRFPTLALEAQPEKIWLQLYLNSV